MVAPQSPSGVISKRSSKSVPETVTRFKEILSSKGVWLFAEIDQAAAAREVGLELRDTVLLVFGNPLAGTPVMEAYPMTALDLPLKVVVWDDEGQTTVSYDSVAAISARRGLDSKLADNLRPIDSLTDALVAF
jgi:uncharacterized protein (DUF302 family)